MLSVLGPTTSGSIQQVYFYCPPLRSWSTLILLAWFLCFNCDSFVRNDNRRTIRQAIHALYFKCFRVLPVPKLMSEIFLASVMSLSQFQAAFYVYIRGFSNMCWSLNIPASASLFFYYFKLNKASNTQDRIGVSRRFHIGI